MLTAINKIGLALTLLATLFIAPKTMAWEKNLTTQLAKLLCADQYYFQVCFGVKKTKCEKAAVQKASLCQQTIGRTSMRKPGSDIEDNKLALKIGHCVGQELEKLWAEHKSSQNKCSEIEAWQ